MDFELTTYTIDQVSHLAINDQPPPPIESITLAFPPNLELSEQNFGIHIKTNDFQPDFYSGDTIVFSKKESELALQNIYLFITKNRKPIIGEIIHRPDSKKNSSNELHKLNSTEYRKARRKSFMTPTPLHIPTSQISPVADSSHERILIRPVGQKQQLSSIFRQKSIYSFPMVFIHKIEN